MFYPSLTRQQDRKVLFPWQADRKQATPRGSLPQRQLLQVQTCWSQQALAARALSQQLCCSWASSTGTRDTNQLAGERCSQNHLRNLEANRVIFTSYLASGIASLAPAAALWVSTGTRGFMQPSTLRVHPAPSSCPPHLVKCPRNCQAGEKFISNLRESA